MKFEIDAKNQKIRLVSGTYYECKTLRNHLTRFEAGYRFKKMFKMRLWNGKQSAYAEDGLFDIGIWKEIFALCQEMNYPFEVVNRKEFPLNRQIDKPTVVKWLIRFFRDHVNKDGTPMSPRDYQLECCADLLRNRYCNIEVATSGGKSLIFSMFAFYLLTEINPDAKILLVVPSIGLVTQFYNEINDLNYGIHNENEKPLDLKMIEIMSDKPRKLRPGESPNIYISTYQSLGNYPPEWFKQFYAVAVDEAHGAKGDTIQYILNNTIPSAYYRWGMTGSFPDPDSWEMLKIQRVSGPVVKEIKATQLQKEGYISKVKVKRILLNYGDTDFHVNVTELRKIDGKAAYELEKLTLQASEKRRDFIVKILEATKNNTLVLFGNIEHGKALFERFSKIPGRRVYYIDGEVKNAERERIKIEMEKTDTPAILVGSYGCVSTGISIKAIINVILADSYKARIRVIQTIGRALRLHAEKTMAYIFDLIDIPDNSPNLKKNVMFDHGIERVLIYNEEKYPHEEIHVNL